MLFLRKTKFCYFHGCHIFLKSTLFYPKFPTGGKWTWRKFWYRDNDSNSKYLSNSNSKNSSLWEYFWDFSPYSSLPSISSAQPLQDPNLSHQPKSPTQSESNSKSNSNSPSPNFSSPNMIPNLHQPQSPYCTTQFMPSVQLISTQTAPNPENSNPNQSPNNLDFSTAKEATMAGEDLLLFRPVYSRKETSKKENNPKNSYH